MSGTGGVGSSERKLSELSKMIEYIARMLVDLPEEVQISEIEGENTTVIELKVAKEDLGKIIGKGGTTIRSIRSVVGIVASARGQEVILEIAK